MAESLTKFTSLESGSEAVGVDLPGELDTASWCDHIVLAGNEMSVVILGKSGSGKSTLARNVLGLPDQPADHATKNCDIQVTSKHGMATKIAETTKVQDLNGRAGLLIYCIPVDPASRFDDGNPAMMKSLQDAYGKDIWKHCIIVFTFSNLAWDRITKKIKDKDTAISEYKQHINNYAAKVKEMLQTLNATEVNVKTIFQNPSEITTEGKSTILAIPAGDEPDDPVLQDFDFVSTNITITDSSQPGKQVRVSVQDWRDALFVDVVKKTQKIAKSLLSCNRHRFATYTFFN